ncbi:MAG: HAD family hydrolase [Candidatus Krumholzibacteria bacterium]|nr:HAD family hydrolase [Candidatus Krumholzibacteria bacterium]
MEVSITRSLRPAIFLDRDGTVSEEVGYVNHVSRFRLLPRTAAAIRQINQSGLLAVLVTNQAGVARGYFKESLVRQVHQRLQELLAAGGARLDGIYYCPHHPRAGKPPYRLECNCRKPKPGMIEAASRDLDIDVSRSFMVGDKHSDIIFAHSVGVPGVLVKTGYGLGEIEQWSADWSDEPDKIALDLLDAVEWILDRQESDDRSDDR